MGVTIGYNGDTIASMNASGSKTLLTSGKYCEGNIEVTYQESTVSLPNYRKYEGTIDADTDGANTKTLILTSADIAAHYSDSTFKVAVYFTPDPEAANTIIQVTGYNISKQEPYRGTGNASSYQYTYREGSVGSFSTNHITIPVNSSSIDNYVGRIQCDAEGHLYIMTGSGSYGVRRGGYVVEITW